ncbi:MAG: 16S rRNA (guanine(527)-N(7))-methyltransferase RsmG [Oscillospiraceae bacterium]|nr:16S rRNA (guanine(527)-N(7))-methyltransferase RsmG [Oscillospiraceae bacterium]
MDIIEIAHAYDIKISRTQKQGLNLFIDIMLETNRRDNLTRIVEKSEINVKHLLDSLMGLTTRLFSDGKKFVDVGAGAGFPSVPLAICSGVKTTQIEASRKKTDFLRKVSEELTPYTQNPVTPIHGRAEEYGVKPEYRELFDIAAARAVTSLNALCELCLPFVKSGGHFVAYKSGEAEDELNRASAAIETLGGRIAEIKKYSLPDGSGRTLVIIEKISDTPEKYPRAYAKLKRTPL